MILNWASEFDAATVMWHSVVAFLLLATLVPGLVLVTSCLTERRAERFLTENWIAFMATAGLAWFAVIYSLTFGPAWDPFAPPPVTTPPMGMGEMMQQAAQADDSQNLYGRGGWIGNLDFAFFRSLPPQGNSDQPMFSSRRPLHQIPHFSVQVCQLSVFLSAIGVIAVVLSNQWSWLKSCVCALIWSVIVYAPTMHWSWGDGWLSARGGFDFGGGLLFLILGCSASAASLCMKSAITAHPENPSGSNCSSTFLPAATLMLLIGTVILSQSLSMPPPGIFAAAAFNCLLAACAGCSAWCGISWFRNGNVTNADAARGLMAGLVSICAGSGLFLPTSAVRVALISTVVAYPVWRILSRFSGSPVFPFSLACLVVPAAIGILSIGIFGHENYGVQHWNGHLISGVAEGNSKQLISQAELVGGIGLFAFAATAAIVVVARLVTKLMRS